MACTNEQPLGLPSVEHLSVLSCFNQPVLMGEF
jgi:hypothetical protein